jgi:Flp pilus assembly protein TadG
MVMRLCFTIRRGGSLVEFAIVAPVTFLLMLGLLIGGMGVFRYQQVAQLARDASRWASVHGTQYAQVTGNPAATATDVYNNAISPYAAGLNLSNLTYSVTWNASNSPAHTNANGQKVANTVTVTVNYQWIPEAYLSGVTLTATSVSVMYF